MLKVENEHIFISFILVVAVDSIWSENTSYCKFTYGFTSIKNRQYDIYI